MKNRAKIDTLLLPILAFWLVLAFAVNSGSIQFDKVLKSVSLEWIELDVDLEEVENNDLFDFSHFLLDQPFSFSALVIAALIILGVSAQTIKRKPIFSLHRYLLFSSLRIPAH